MYKRNRDLSITTLQSCFWWGPCQTRKSTLLKSTFPDAPYYDLLLASDFRRLLQESTPPAAEECDWHEALPEPIKRPRSLLMKCRS
jgi:hypothetical protein